MQNDKRVGQKERRFLQNDKRRDKLSGDKRALQTGWDKRARQKQRRFLQNDKRRGQKGGTNWMDKLGVTNWASLRPFCHAESVSTALVIIGEILSE
ncbi:hypothetical protein CO230_01575 [Chryseobacterium sp. 6424]|nr:hypothetical protein CO230_01575 [Chryseobacterium sp. 6424]